VGNPAPAFALSDVEGHKVRLADYDGKAMIIEFWATWCGPCRDSIPEMNELNKKFLGKNAIVLGISVDEGSSAAQKVSSFASEYGVEYRVLLDDSNTSAAYGVMNIPVLFILDRKHTVVKKYIGFSPGMSEDLSREIEALL
jgi:peroxiredoxin